MFRPQATAARFLLSDEGARWLEQAAKLPGTPASHLADLSYLRQHLTPDLAAAVLEQVHLQTRAACRFDRADRMLFTDAGLQQTTHPIVAAHRAERFRACALVADLGCGLGSDTIALAKVVKQALAVDKDSIRLLFARHNVGVYGLSDRVAFIQADALSTPFLPSNLALFCDPGRRTTAGRRTFKPEYFEPPLPLLWERLGGARGLAIKVAPGISYDSLPWAEEIEFVSLDGQVKEATLWCGELVTPGVHRRATLLPSGVTITDTQIAEPYPVRPVGRYLFEPDAAVIRAGLVRQIGAQLGLWQLDDRIAYLSGDVSVESPFVQGFEVEEQLPFSLKPIRRRLSELRVGILEIKKRGIALDPDDFRGRLRLHGQESKTLILTRIGEKPVAFLCRRKKTREVPETSRV